MRRRRKFLLTAAVIAIAACVLFCGYYYGEKRKELTDTSILAFLDGEPITYGEFRLYFPRYRSMVVTQMNREYGMTDSEVFWETELPDGSTPIALARSYTMDALQAVKARQLLFLEYGVCQDISYESFREQWMAENERRADAVKNGQVIYGPKQYEEDRYYEYLQAQYQNGLERVLEADMPERAEAVGGTTALTNLLVQEKLEEADFRVEALIDKIQAR